LRHIISILFIEDAIYDDELLVNANLSINLSIN
jgi:hypothetical protein